MEYFGQKKEEKMLFAGSKHFYFTDVLHFPPLNFSHYVFKDTRQNLKFKGSKEDLMYAASKSMGPYSIQVSPERIKCIKMYSCLL